MTTPDPKTVREIARDCAADYLADATDIAAHVMGHFGIGVPGNVYAWTDAVRADLHAVVVSWPDEQQPAEATGGEQARDGAVEAPCVCGDPDCMPYWRPVHQKMNGMRLRSDRLAADFTNAMIEEICEERTRAEQAEAERDALAARVVELESEREADARVVARASRANAAAEDFGEGLEAWFAAADALFAHFAGRIAEVDADPNGGAQ
jgi:hypothetical protein